MPTQAAKIATIDPINVINSMPPRRLAISTGYPELASKEKSFSNMEHIQSSDG
jgi:hypothetical protein